MTDPSRPDLAEALANVRTRTDLEPRIALILGSGLGAIADTFDDRVAISYEDLPGMPRSTVAGHAGQLVLGRLGGVPLVAMQGRVHLYEGHDPAVIANGVHLMRALGASVLIVTNAAGGLNPDFTPGDLMLITDQLNLTGKSPLVGPNDESIGPRFPDMGEAYTPALRATAREAAAEVNVALREGVYAGVLGPQYESPAEVRMLRMLGGDAVGMSTVLEVIAARHAGLRVVGISCITNAAAGLADEVLDHADVERVAKEARARFGGLVRALVARLGEGA